MGVTFEQSKIVGYHKQAAWKAYQHGVKNPGKTGRDKIPLQMFHEEHMRHLYKLCNGMASGSLIFLHLVKKAPIPMKFEILTTLP